VPAVPAVPAAPAVPGRAPLAAARRRVGALLLTALSSAVVLAEPAAAAPAEVRRYSLTTAQERVVLRLVDDVCGDTWCEGDHAFRFRRFSCHPRRGYVLRVELASWSQEPRRWHTRSARVLGFPRYADMVVTAPGGERSLQPAFYEAVGRAVRTMTASVP
jgi:hypothetical protein